MSHAVIVREYGGPDVMQWEERSVPVPGQVRVRVTFSGVNYAGVLARRGGYLNSRLPFAPGLDAVGVVDALGAGITDLKMGQRVACYPAGGGVGHVAAQYARALGAGRMIGVVGSAARAAFIRRLGVDDVIDRHHEDFAARVSEITDGRGVDVILDSVGGDTAERGAGILARFGRLVTYGHASGGPGLIPTAPLPRCTAAPRVPRCDGLQQRHPAPAPARAGPTDHAGSHDVSGARRREVDDRRAGAAGRGRQSA